MRRAKASWATALVLLSCVAACRREAVPPGEEEVARFGDDAVRLAELEDYLDVHLPAVGDPAGDDPALDEVRSRLLDALVDERLMLAEAERRGIEVEPWELEAYLAMDETAGERGNAAPETQPRAVLETLDGAPREALERLKVQKMLEGLFEGLPAPGEAEVRAWAESHRKQLLPERRLELSALLFESEETARKVHREIRRRRMTFAEAVVAHEAYPGQVRPLRIDWALLSDPMREALGELEPGQVSPPLEFHGRIYLFRVDSWLEEPDQIEAELLERARADLGASRRREAQDEFGRELRRQTPVRIRARALPFRYVRQE